MSWNKKFEKPGALEKDPAGHGAQIEDTVAPGARECMTFH
jgi:hypothetical protein